MKHIILTTILLFSGINFVTGQENSKENTERKMKKIVEIANSTSNKEELDDITAQWYKNFKGYLLDHENPNINIYALLDQSLEFSEKTTMQQDNPIDLQEFANSLNSTVENSLLSTQSLMIAADICSRSYISDFCDLKLIHKKLVLSDPENLIVYIPLLKVAVETNDKIEITTLLNKISNTRYSNWTSSLPKQLEKVIDEYTQNHPYHDKMIDHELEMIRTLKTIPADTIEEINNDFSGFQSYMNKVHFKLITPTPPMRPLIDVCKTDESLISMCLKSSNIMINNNKSIIISMVGYSIKTQILKLLGEQTMAADNEIAKEDYKKKYECLMRLKSIGPKQLDLYLNAADFAMFSELERTQGQIATLKKMAEINYQYQLDSGNVNAVNPESCFN